MTVPCRTDWETRKKSYLGRSELERRGGGAQASPLAIRQPHLSGRVTSESTTVPLGGLDGFPFILHNVHMNINFRLGTT